MCYQRIFSHVCKTCKKPLKVKFYPDYCGDAKANNKTLGECIWGLQEREVEVNAGTCSACKVPPQK
jgi:hypothetical protein